MDKVLVLGGYGNFGWRICKALAKEKITVIIAGRNRNKAQKLATQIKAEYPNSSIDVAIFNVQHELTEQLKTLTPKVVINTCGPFQTTNWAIPKACIKAKAHYIDLADARDFVRDITSLNHDAKTNDTLVISGASTVPGISSAVLEEYKDEFSKIESLIFGVAPAQKAPRGLATTKGILTYVGKPLKPFFGTNKTVYGWQDLYCQPYPIIGKRWMANCDVPDLDLLPQHYGIEHIRFSAGMENVGLHFGIWLVSWFVRLGLPIDLAKHATLLWKFSFAFDLFGSKNGGMHMLIKGKNFQNQPHERNWFIIAKNNDGPYIPTVPAIVITKKLLANTISQTGAMPCVGLVSLAECMNELQSFDIETIVH